MKTLFIPFIFLCSFLVAQPLENSGLVQAKYGIGVVDTAIYHNVSLGVEVVLGKHWGLNYNYDFIFRNDRIFQMHSSPGLIAIPLFFNFYLHVNDDEYMNQVFESGLFFQYQLLAIMVSVVDMVVPEGVSFHIPLKNKWDIAPYANVIGVDYIKNRNIDKFYLRYSFNFGARATYWSEKNLTLGAFFETRKTWGMGWAPGGGLTVGYNFLY